MSVSEMQRDKNNYPHSSASFIGTPPLPAKDTAMPPCDSRHNLRRDTIQVFVHSGALRRTVAIETSVKLFSSSLKRQALKVLKTAGLDASKTMFVMYGREVAEGARLKIGQTLHLMDRAGLQGGSTVRLKQDTTRQNLRSKKIRVSRDDALEATVQNDDLVQDDLDHEHDFDAFDAFDMNSFTRTLQYDSAAIEMRKMTPGQMGDLREKIERKCEQTGLFKALLKHGEQRGLDSNWSRFFKQVCTDQDLVSIDQVDMNNGYDTGSLSDQASYFSLLPKETQLETFEKTCKQDDDVEIEFDSFLRDINTFRTTTSFNGALAQDLKAKFQKMGKLPSRSSGMKALDFDYIQFQRLISLNTQKRCSLEEICYPNAEVETLMTAITGKLLFIMQEVLFNDGQNTDTSIIERDIMDLFADEEKDLHDESDTDYQLQQFKHLAKHQPSQDAFASHLLSHTFLIYQYVGWDLVLSDPEKLQKMGLIMETFKFETQSLFFKRLAKVMLEQDQTVAGSEFHPEILAFRERDLMDEIVLQKPFLSEGAQAKGRQKSYWISYYPIMCYLSKDEQDRACRLVFHNLVDPGSEPQVWSLSQDEEFVTFIHTNLVKTSAKICVLLKKRSGYLVRRYIYERPFEKKDLRDESLWKIDDSLQLGQDRHSALINALRVGESQVQKILLVERLAGKSLALILQVNESAFVYDVNECKLTDLLLDRQGRSVKLEILRGSSNNFYMAVRDDLSGTDSLHRLSFTVDLSSGSLLLENIRMATPTNGNIIALELAPNVNSSGDPITLGDEESGFDISDGLYLIDRRYALHHVAVQGRQATPVTKHDLSKHTNLQNAIEHHVEDQDFVRLAINDKVISILGKTYNLHNGHEWEFVFAGRVHKSTYKKKEVYKLEPIPLSQIQMALCYERGNYQLCFKQSPNSRRVVAFDYRRRDVLLAKMISSNRLLVKIKGSDEKPEPYWALLSQYGRLQEIPKKLKEILASQNWNSVSVRKFHNSSIRGLVREQVIDDVISREKAEDKYHSMLVFSTYDSASCDFPTSRVQDLPSYSIHKISSLQETQQESQSSCFAMASILVNNKVNEVVQTRVFDKRELQQCVSDSLAKDMARNNLRMKFMISARGSISIALIDPSRDGFAITHQTIENESMSQHLSMDLEFIRLGKGHMKHFTTQDEALLIDNVIYVKGPTNQMLRIKVAPQDNINELGSRYSTVFLPIGAPGEESVISTASNLYRVDNLDVELDESKVIRKEMFQLSYESTIKTTLLSKVDEFNNAYKKGEFVNPKGQDSQISGTDILCDPETFVDPGIKLQYQTPRTIDVEGTREDVKIWTRMNSDMSKKVYFMSQDWWWTNSTQKPLNTFGYLGLYRKFSEVDIHEILRLNKLDRQKKTIQDPEPRSLLCSLEGKTIFEAFFKKKGVLQAILDWLTIEEFDEEMDDEGNDLEHQIFRKIYYLLGANTINKNYRLTKLLQSQVSMRKSGLNKSQKDFNEQQKPDHLPEKDQDGKLECDSLLYRALYTDGAEVMSRDLIFKIAGRCQEFALTNIFITQKDVQQVLKMPTTSLLESLDNVLLQTRYTASIQTLDMSAKRPLIAFRSEDIRVDQTSLQKQLDDKMKVRGAFTWRNLATKSTQVHVSVMSLQWMERGGLNFLDFVDILDQTPNKSILQTKFVDVIFESFWRTYQKRIFWTHLWPYVFVLAFTSQNYAMFFAEQRNIFKETPFNWYGKFVPFIGMCLMFLFNQVVNETVQIQTVGLKSYFSSFMNWVDLGYLIPSIAFTVASYRWDDTLLFSRTEMAFLAGGSNLLSLGKMVGFLRLFDKTSFYLKLVIQTIANTKQFLGLWVLAIFAFGVMPYYLNLARVDKPIDDFVFSKDTQLWTNDKTGDSYTMDGFETYKDSESFMTDHYGQEGYFLDVVLSVMHVGVAGMELGKYDGIYSQFLYVFIMVAVLVLNVTMLNMLIAIMGDIYDETSEKRKKFRRETQLEKLSEYIGMIVPSETDPDFGFLHSPLERLRLVFGYDKREIYLNRYVGQNLYVCQMDAFMVVDEGEEEWEGKIQFLKRYMEKLIISKSDMMTSKIEKLNEKINYNDTKLDLQDQQLKMQMKRMQNDVTQVAKDVRTLIENRR